MSRRAGAGSTRRWVVCALAVGLLFAGWALWPHLQLSYRLRSASALLATGDAEQALLVLTPVESEHPDSAELQFLLGVAHRRANHLRKCRDYLRRSAELGWPRSEVRIQQLMADFQGGDSAAEAELNAFLRLPMDDDIAEQVCEALTKGYFGKFWLNQALTCLDHWISWRPDNPRPRHLRAMILGMSGDLPQQIEDYRAILAASPDDFSAHALLGDALIRTNDVDQALTQYRWCREHAPADPLAALGIAACLRRKGDYQGARDLLAEVVANQELPEGNRGRLLAELGEVALELGEVEKAQGYLVEAVKLLPFDGPTHYSCGMALARTGKKEEADKLFKRAEELNRDSGRIFDLERELANNPDDADLRYEAAMLVKAQKLDYEAKTLMLTALKLDPTHVRAHAALAEWYEQEGKEDEASRHRAAARGPQDDPAGNMTDGGS